MSFVDDLISGERKLSLVGLGYVGLPIAVAFAKRVQVVGFDLSEEKIGAYLRGNDPTGEVGDDSVASCTVRFTSDEGELKSCSFHIVAVPTPVDPDHTPNLSPVISASHTVGRNLARGSIVVYESTVYPGVTEDICIPILEQESGLVCGKDFKVGYSPERINPGDKEHRLNNIVKIVSGCDEEALRDIADVYELVVDVGVYRAQSIQVAEAAKVIENSQRDINIAFVNELSQIFDRMGIDTLSVLEAAGTKWNFLDFKPGLVGGHCIGVDPYYLTYKAEMLGYHSQVILAGRCVNDYMGRYVANTCVKMLIKEGFVVSKARVGILGLTFKENCPDVRNTRVIDIINELSEYGIAPIVCDPVADEADAERTYGIGLVPLDRVKALDALIVATAHSEFSQLSAADLKRVFKTGDGKNILLDVKGIIDQEVLESMSCCYWRL